MESEQNQKGENPEEIKPMAKKQNKNPLKAIIEGTILTRENVVKQLPFLIYVVLMAVLYIANSYNAEKAIIESTRTKKLNEEYRYSYISTHSKLMNVSRQSELAHKLAPTGLKELKTPPHKIILKENNN
jgi:cell division protein FtsL